MSDIFLKPDVLDLLDNKFILMIGDSNIKSIYKDLLYLYTQNDIAPPSFFRTTGGQDRWESCCGDTVLHLPSVVTAGRDNFEEREYRDDHVQIRFHFVTKVYGKAMRCVLKLIEDGSIPMPNIVVMNSCIWDLTRWGPKQEDNYKKDLISLFSKIRKILSGDTLIIWSSTLPIAVEQCKGGIFIKQLEFMRHSLRFMILEANKLTQHLCVAFEIDFLDLHYHMRYQLHRRAIDGIHWETHAIRMLTNLILTHIALSFDVPLPGHVRTGYLKSAIDKAAEVNTPPDLNKIGFHKDMQDQIEDELKRIVPTSCQNKPNKNADDSETSDRVFRNARRRGKGLEGNLYRTKSKNSNSAIERLIKGNTKKKDDMEYDALCMLKNKIRENQFERTSSFEKLECSKTEDIKKVEMTKNHADKIHSSFSTTIESELRASELALFDDILNFEECKLKKSLFLKGNDIPMRPLSAFTSSPLLPASLPVTSSGVDISHNVTSINAGVSIAHSFYQSVPLNSPITLSIMKNSSSVQPVPASLQNVLPSCTSGLFLVSKSSQENSSAYHENSTNGLPVNVYESSQYASNILVNASCLLPTLSSSHYSTATLSVNSSGNCTVPVSLSSHYAPVLPINSAGLLPNPKCSQIDAPTMPAILSDLQPNSSPFQYASPTLPVYSSGLLPTPVSSGLLPTPVSSSLLPTPVSSGLLPMPVSSSLLLTPVSSGLLPTPVSSGLLLTPVSSGIVPTPVYLLPMPVSSALQHSHYSGLPNVHSTNEPAASNILDFPKVTSPNVDDSKTLLQYVTVGSYLADYNEDKKYSNKNVGKIFDSLDSVENKFSGNSKKILKNTLQHAEQKVDTTNKNVDLREWLKLKRQKKQKLISVLEGEPHEYGFNNSKLQKSFTKKGKVKNNQVWPSSVLNPSTILMNNLNRKRRRKNIRKVRNSTTDLNMPKAGICEKIASPPSEVYCTSFSTNNQVTTEMNNDIPEKCGGKSNSFVTKTIRQSDSFKTSLSQFCLDSEKACCIDSTDSSKPLSSKKSKPLNFKESKPLKSKESKSLIYKESTPLIYKESTPLIYKVSKPLIYKESKQLIYKESNQLHSKESTTLYSEESMRLYSGDSKPLYFEESKQLSSNKLKPLNSEKSKPLYSKESKLLYSEESKPRYSKESKPLYFEESNPLYSKESNPLYSKESKPFNYEESKPLYSEESKPLYFEESKPLYSDKSKLLNFEESKPLFSEESKPLYSKESKPPFFKESKPFNYEESKPLYSEESKPLYSEKSKPLNFEESKPLYSEESKSLSSEESKSLYSEESKSLYSEESKPFYSEESKPPNSEKSKPLNSKESNPLYSKESKPLHSKESKPLNSMEFTKLFAKEDGSWFNDSAADNRKCSQNDLVSKVITNPHSLNCVSAVTKLIPSIGESHSLNNSVFQTNASLTRIPLLRNKSSTNIPRREFLNFGMDLEHDLSYYLDYTPY